MTAIRPVLRVVERETMVFRRLWWSSLGYAVVAPILFLGAIGLGLGGLVDERSGPVDGLSYLAFVTPGLLAGGAMQVAAGESLWPVMARLKWIGTFKAMVATPVGAADAYTGLLAWSALRCVINAVVFLTVAALLGGVPSAWAVLGVPAAVLCALAFAAPITAFSATQEDDHRFSFINRMIVMPLFLFSGTFFPIERLPAALQGLAVLSPLWHGAELARAATRGSAEAGAVVVHLAVLVAIIAVGAAWGRRTFTRRLAL